MARMLRPEVLAYVEQLLGMFLKPPQVIDQTCAKFGIAPRTARRYLAAVREEWRARGDVSRDERRAQLRGEFEKLYRKALSLGHIRTAKECLVDLVKLDGLDAPSRIEMKHLAVDLEAGTLTGREAILERLAELRAEQDSAGNEPN